MSAPTNPFSSSTGLLKRAADDIPLGSRVSLSNRPGQYVVKGYVKAYLKPSFFDDILDEMAFGDAYYGYCTFEEAEFIICKSIGTHYVPKEKVTVQDRKDVSDQESSLYRKKLGKLVDWMPGLSEKQTPSVDRSVNRPSALLRR